MDKKIFAIFKKNKIEIDEFEKLEIEQAVEQEKKHIILNGKKLKMSDFVEIREEDAESPIDKYQREWVENSRKRVLMSPDLRAENTKGHFTLWFWSIYNKLPTDEIWQKAKIAIQKFYEKNPDMIYPYVKFYFEIVKGSKNKPANEHAFRLLERIEGNLLSFSSRKLSTDFVLTKNKQGV